MSEILFESPAVSLRELIYSQEPKADGTCSTMQSQGCYMIPRRKRQTSIRNALCPLLKKERSSDLIVKCAISWKSRLLMSRYPALISQQVIMRLHKNAVFDNIVTIFTKLTNVSDQSHIIYHSTHT